MTERRPRIFVAIASYRDRECQWTVKDLFEKARHPERVFVGICWQFDPHTDADCFEVAARPAHVRRVDFRLADAKGLGWARARTQALWRGEEFTLQIDSHMRFVADWDERMLAELAACPSRKPVLTIYPASYWPPNELQRPDEDHIWVQAVERFNPSGILQYTCHTASGTVPRDSPRPTAGLAGGFIFGSSRMIRDVPSDPELYFEGEEPNLAVRLWTHGYDLFSPRETLIYHYYRRIDGRRPWNDTSHVAPNERSLARLRRLFEPAPGDADILGRYGLGNARSLADYEAFAGVDFRAKTVASFVYHYPYVYSDEVTALLIGLTPLAPADDAHLFMLDDEGILFCGRSRAFYRLSPIATYCWCAIEGGFDLAELIRGLAQRTGLTPAAARQRAHNQICHWQRMGALQTGESTARGTFNDTAPAPVDARWAPRPPLGVAPRERIFRVLGSSVRVQAYGAYYDQLVAAVLGHLAIVDRAPDSPDARVHRIQLMSVGRLHYLVRDDRFPPAWVEHRDAMAALLLGAIDEIVREAPSSLLLLRAGLIEHAGGALLLLGEPLLIAQLVATFGGPVSGSSGGAAERLARAHPELLIDHMLVQIDRAGGRAQFVPKPVVIPPDWFELGVADLPPADSLPAFGGFSVPRVRFLPFERPGGSRSLAVTHLVVVGLAEAGASGTVATRPIPPVERLTLLTSAAAPSLLGPTVADAAALIDWMSTLPAVELIAADLAQCAERLAELVLPRPRTTHDMHRASGIPSPVRTD